MVRTQIQLTEEQARLARRLAAERHVSMAEVLREGLELLARSRAHAVPAEERRRRAQAVAGRFHSGSSDGSAKHDAYLAEAYRP